MPAIPALWEAQESGPLEPRGSRPIWATRGYTISTKKCQKKKNEEEKIGWAWWCAPVVPATREAEAGELLEFRRQRLR